MTRKNIFLTCAALFFMLSSHLSAFSQAADTMRTYIFGHSLINHEWQVNPTPSNETSVPHWFHFLSQEANRHYEVSGQYGFLPQHATNTPVAQWGFDSVPSAWEDWLEPFSDAGFSNILITPANFAQWQPPHFLYPGDSLSPITATDMVFDWVNAQGGPDNLYIYENWPDMAPYLANGFPPTATEWTNYNAYLNGAFHDWFLDYHDSMRVRFPNQCVRMIPTGPVISNLLAQPPFDQIAIDTLYEDDAPHGRPTVYFLAALVTYMAMHEEMAPLSYQVPAIIDPIVPIVQNNYPQAVNYIWNQLLAFNDSNGDSRVFCNPPIVMDIGDDPTAPADFVDAEAAAAAITVYPNPTTGRIRIQGDLEDYRVEVLDLSGRNLRIGLQAEQGLDLNGLPAGLYLVRFRHVNGGPMVVKKVMKE
ncbi:MAG: T9SS type A sorting domain-containing protein [Bacteroidota bacterium]